MTTFQGQSAKRHSNKKNFKSGQNQPNAIFIFITFRNHRRKFLSCFTSTSVADSENQMKKGHLNPSRMTTFWGKRPNIRQIRKIEWNGKMNERQPFDYEFPESWANIFWCYFVIYMQVCQIPEIILKKIKTQFPKDETWCQSISQWRASRWTLVFFGEVDEFFYWFKWMFLRKCSYLGFIGRNPYTLNLSVVWSG